MKITAVILNYRGTKDTISCIKSLKNCIHKDISLQIIVVDNGSEDNSNTLISQQKGIVSLINSQNFGFTGGMNIGIKKALEENPDYILILNNDIEVDKLFIENLAKKAKNNTIISPKIYFAKGSEFHKSRYKKNDLGNVIWYAGGKIDWDNILGIHIGVDEVDKGQFEKTREIDFATGAAMLIPTEVIGKIGLLDENYFLYLEDLDYSVRAKKAGFKIIFEPSAIMWHKNAASTGGSGSNLQDYFISRNRLIFAFKYAKLKTKFAVLKQLIMQVNQPTKRKAVFDFIFRNLKQGSYKP